MEIHYIPDVCSMYSMWNDSTGSGQDLGNGDQYEERHKTWRQNNITDVCRTCMTRQYWIRLRPRKWRSVRRTTWNMETNIITDMCRTCTTRRHWSWPRPRTWRSTWRTTWSEHTSTWRWSGSDSTRPRWAWTVLGSIPLFIWEFCTYKLVLDQLHGMPHKRKRTMYKIPSSTVWSFTITRRISQILIKYFNILSNLCNGLKIYLEQVSWMVSFQSYK